MLNCPNARCQAVNNLDSKFCQVCGTPLVKRYLRPLGLTMVARRIGETIAGRYLVVQPQLLLDTQPATSPETPEDFPSEISAYLRLFSQRLHVPQVYGMVFDTSPIWLLEGVPLVGDRLAPELTTVWAEAHPLQQLAWLRQIASLWEPLQTQGVNASLLNPELLRVNSSLVKLLELRTNSQVIGLPDLGQQWLTLVQPQSLIAKFLEELGVQLITSAIATPQDLIATLDAGIHQCQGAVQRRYQVLSATDKGPTREGNEDACYPAPGVGTPLGSEVLAIVCDGIGGHEGGEVASGSAITTIKSQIDQIISGAPSYTAPELEKKLVRAVGMANDVISDRNDLEQRQSRQRMGTTLVMAWSYAQELYLSHVGDSRAYWITASGCFQLTLDDDIASREVCLGYALYREALKYPSSGSLVQALGMTSSENLYPTVQRFTPQESGVFLLCSDGLSDYDRVEQNWETLVLPILCGESDLPTVVAKLIDLANTQNGHDNVTVALVYCQVVFTPLATPLVFHKIAAPLLKETPTNPQPLAPLKIIKTMELPKSRNPPYFLGLIVVLLAGGAGIGGAIQLGLLNPDTIFSKFRNQAVTPTPEPTLTSIPTPRVSIASPIAKSPTPPSDSITTFTIQPGDRLKLTSAILLPLTKNPNQRVDLPANTILQVVKQTASANQEKLVELTVCSVPKIDPNASILNNSSLGNITIPALSLAAVVDSKYPKSFSVAIGKCGAN